VNAFTHSAEIEVRFRDSDAMGHVNNSVYLTYLEVGRQSYWKRLAADVPYDRVPFVLAHAELDFRSLAHTGETLRVLLRTSWVGRSSFGMAYEIREAVSGRLVVEATSVQVTYDYEQHAAMPVPDWLRRGLESVEGGPLPARPGGGA
jgi:acyl-CoA thioester hydrolase